jgi:hypothetical protein
MSADDDGEDGEEHEHEEESGGFVAAAMRDAGLDKLDERGLMPLAKARPLVRKATEFRKGKGRMVRGSFVLDSDKLWAALLSLEDAAEFVREASRLRWFFHPRGQDNTGALERYGDAILPWLARFVRPDGCFVNVPWCVKPCLLAIDKPEVLDLLWRVKCVREGAGDEWPGPFAADNEGDADRRSGTNLDAPAPAEPDDDADELVFAWITAHAPTALPLVARRAASDPRARLMLKTMADLNPAKTFAAVSAALGEDEARKIFAASAAPTHLDERVVLWSLSTGARSGNWPVFHTEDPDDAYHALRLTAVRERGGEGFWVIFQRLEGWHDDSLRIQTWVLGTDANGSMGLEQIHFYVDHEDQEDVAPEPRAAEDEASPYDIEGVTVTGPAGPLTLHNSMIASLDLRPDRAPAGDAPPSRIAVMLRAYLARHPGAFWDDPRAVAEALLGGPAYLGDRDFDVVVVSDAFEHVLGAAEDDEDAPPHEAKWRVDPAESPVFRSLARAIVARDGALFEPGVSNLDWRLHALSPVVDEDASEA